jgi:acyl carrier protein
MTEQQILVEIERLVGEIASGKGVSAPKVSAETELLDGSLSIDSLDLATLVRELEDVTGHDPFRDGFVNFRTAGELAKLYVR